MESNNNNMRSYNRIFFIGNCQAVSLAIFFSELLDDHEKISWLSYSEAFHEHLGDWVKTKESGRTQFKCKMIIDIVALKDLNLQSDDIIIYQSITPETSKFHNYIEVRKQKCKYICIPNLRIETNDKFGFEKLSSAEKKQAVEIPMADYIFQKGLSKTMLDSVHPSTETFLYIVREIDKKLELSLGIGIEKLHCKKYKIRNYTELPCKNAIWQKLKNLASIFKKKSIGKDV